ncbi:hypothetical protein ACTXT7_002127, partial [Hymenolepis weldensis]
MRLKDEISRVISVINDLSTSNEQATFCSISENLPTDLPSDRLQEILNEAISRGSISKNSEDGSYQPTRTLRPHRQSIPAVTPRLNFPIGAPAVSRPHPRRMSMTSLNANFGPMSTHCSYCLGDINNNVKNGGTPEDMVICWKCGLAAHISCQALTAEIGTRLKRIRWNCMSCKRCVICIPDLKDSQKPAASDDQNSDLLLCDNCDRGYHLGCVEPGLSQPPEGEWICPICRVYPDGYPLSAIDPSLDSQLQKTAIMDKLSPEEMAFIENTLKGRFLPKKSVGKHSAAASSKTLKSAPKSAVSEASVQVVKVEASAKIRDQPSSPAVVLSDDERVSSMKHKRVTRHSSRVSEDARATRLSVMRRRSAGNSPSPDAAALRSPTRRRSRLGGLETSLSENDLPESVEKTEIKNISKTEAPETGLSYKSDIPRQSHSHRGRKRGRSQILKRSPVTNGHSPVISITKRQLSSRRRTSRGHSAATMPLEILDDQVEGTLLEFTESPKGKKRESHEEPQQLQSEEEDEVDEDLRFKSIAEDDRGLFQNVQLQVQRNLPQALESSTQLPPTDNPLLLLNNSTASTGGKLSKRTSVPNSLKVLTPLQPRCPPRIQLGKYCIETWYSAPYPSEYARPTLFFDAEKLSKLKAKYDERSKNWIKIKIDCLRWSPLTDTKCIKSSLVDEISTHSSHIASPIHSPRHSSPNSPRRQPGRPVISPSRSRNVSTSNPSPPIKRRRGRPSKNATRQIPASSAAAATNFPPTSRLYFLQPPANKSSTLLESFPLPTSFDVVESTSLDIHSTGKETAAATSNKEVPPPQHPCKKDGVLFNQHKPPDSPSGGPGSVLSNSTSSNINTPSTACTNSTSKVTSSTNEKSGTSTNNRAPSRGRGRDSLLFKSQSRLHFRHLERRSTVTAAALKCMDIRTFVIKNSGESEHDESTCQNGGGIGNLVTLATSPVETARHSTSISPPICFGQDVATSSNGLISDIISPQEHAGSHFIPHSRSKPHMENLSSSEDQAIQKTSTSTENVTDGPKPFPVVNISPGIFGNFSNFAANKVEYKIDVCLVGSEMEKYIARLRGNEDTPGTSPMYAPSEGSDSTDPMNLGEEGKLTPATRKKHKMSSRRRRSAIPAHFQKHSCSPLPQIQTAQVITTLETSMVEEICEPLLPIPYQTPLESVTTTEPKPLYHPDVSVCPVYSATPNSDSVSSTSPPFTFPQPNGTGSVPPPSNRPPSPVFPAPLSAENGVACGHPTVSVPSMTTTTMFQPSPDIVWMPIPGEFTFVQHPEPFQRPLYSMPSYEFQPPQTFYDPTTSLQMVPCPATPDFQPPQSMPFNQHPSHQQPQPVMMYPQMLPPQQMFVPPPSTYIPTPCPGPSPQYMMMMNHSQFHQIPTQQPVPTPTEMPQSNMQPIPLPSTIPQQQPFVSNGVIEPPPAATDWMSSPYPLRMSQLKKRKIWSAFLAEAVPRFLTTQHDEAKRVAL